MTRFAAWLGALWDQDVVKLRVDLRTGRRQGRGECRGVHSFRLSKVPPALQVSDRPIERAKASRLQASDFGCSELELTSSKFGCINPKEPQYLDQGYRGTGVPAACRSLAT